MPYVSRTRNVQYTRTSPIVRPISVFPGVHCRDRRARGSDCLSLEEQQAWYRASGIVSPKKKSSIKELCFGGLKFHRFGLRSRGLM